MNEIDLLKEKVLRLERQMNLIGRSRSGLLVEPTRNLLGQDTYLKGYYVPVPAGLTVPLTSTSYDGNDTVSVGTVTIDTSSVFGAPVGIKFCAVYMRATWATANAGYSMGIRPVGGSLYTTGVYSQVDNLPNTAWGVVTCDANGDFDLAVGGANATNVVLRITDYWI